MKGREKGIEPPLFPADRVVEIAMTELKCTPAAWAVLNVLREKNGNIILLISGGCCDGSAPLCFAESEFRIGEGDVKLGQIGGCSVYVSSALADYYKDSELFYLDVTEGRGGGFSLEAPMGVRFVNRGACPA